MEWQIENTMIGRMEWPFLATVFSLLWLSFISLCTQYSSKHAISDIMPFHWVMQFTYSLLGKPSLTWRLWTAKFISISEGAALHTLIFNTVYSVAYCILTCSLSSSIARSLVLAGHLLYPSRLHKALCSRSRDMSGTNMVLWPDTCPARPSLGYATVSFTLTRYRHTVSTLLHSFCHMYKS